MAPMRNRIKHDPFFFGLILLFLWFGGFSFGVTFYFFRDPGSLLATIGCCLVAAVLFRWHAA